MIWLALVNPLADRIADAGTPNRVDIWFRLSFCETVICVPPCALQPTAPVEATRVGGAAEWVGAGLAAATGRGVEGGLSASDWIRPVRIAGPGFRVPSGRLPVAEGSASNGFENGLVSREASEEQAAAAPPMMPMSATRESVRNI